MLIIAILMLTLLGVSDGITMFVKARMNTCKVDRNSIDTSGAMFNDRYDEIRNIGSSVPDVNGCLPDCGSEIYCKGVNEKGEHTLLHDVQMVRIYEYGTTFVKSRMKYSEAEILEKYAAAKDKKPDKKLSRPELEKFVRENFENTTLYRANLPDFIENPPILKKVENLKLKKWLSNLNQLWRQFAREIPEYVMKQEEKGDLRSSYLYVPNTFIVPGDRFDETYYWDSYWIIKGLLACGMRETSKGIIGNMVHLIKRYGYVPNGNRIYYSRRSQPPMLIQMVDSYYQETNDECIIKENLRYLEAEFKWWLNNRMVMVKKGVGHYYVFRYQAVSCYPRPESYKEDFELFENYQPQDPDIAKVIYSGIRSALESGWDFSSRHMRNPENAQNTQDGLRDMNLRHFAYVDLSSIMYSNAKILAEWERNFAGNKEKADEYDKWASKFLNAIEKVFWNEEEGIWLDYDILSGKSREYFYASNFVPLWSKAYKNDLTKVQLAINYLQVNLMIYSNLTSVHYGVPTSNVDQKSSKQQWDYPNVWAPLQSFIIRGLKESNDPTAEKVAYNLATSFMKTVYAAYLKDNEIYGTYDAMINGEIGGKGEYGRVIRSGWTIGVIFELFSLWNCFSLTPDITCPNIPMI